VLIILFPPQHCWIPRW